MKIIYYLFYLIKIQRKNRVIDISKHLFQITSTKKVKFLFQTPKRYSHKRETSLEIISAFFFNLI